MSFKNSCGLLIFLCFLFVLNLKSINIYAVNSRPVPKVVYRATPEKPDEVFKNGFSRPRNGHTNLALHIENESGDPSTAMISTTSSLDYAVYYAAQYARTYWNVEEYYIYEIIPQSNFIDVTATYERTLQETRHPGRRAGLESLRWHFTREYEYTALYFISPVTILSATRYVLNHEISTYAPEETIQNLNAQTNNMPTVYPNIYPLGTVDGLDYPLVNTGCVLNANYSGKLYLFNTGVPPYPTTTLPSNRPKREMPSALHTCFANSFHNKIDTKFNTKFPIKIEVKNIFDEKYCLTTFPYNNVRIAKCSESHNWYFTEFGQLIAEAKDEHNEQYYCLTEAEGNNTNSFIKMQLCDLSEKKQLWKVEFTKHDQVFIKSSSNKILHAHENSYKTAYVRVKPNKNILSLNNLAVLKSNQTEPFIQFSIDNLLSINGEVIYPTEQGYIYAVKPPDAFKRNKTYYNAHNNILFSTFENSSDSSAVCYVSSLIEAGGSSWGWVKNHHCSTKSISNNSFKWILHRNDNDNGYAISDIGANLLRVNKNSTLNKNYVYTANNHGYYDDSNFVQEFLFNAPAQIFADRVSKIDNDYQTNSTKLISAFNGLRNYYYNLIFPIIYKIDVH